MMHLKLKGEHLGTAEFTWDMVETLREYFELYADEDGVVSLEVREGGIFLPPLVGDHRQFLGLARMPKHIERS
ncbi:hypothetical protein Q4511_15855 [Paracoccus sp. 1_MG-2023]|uniref:hypothetical protein n=1 Tax=unclassified Paracoccus (in: a-proteobacteria) TaxID=2688777 RepID=UPI001C098B3D|nr:MULTISPECIES: hypothetical protein [unclassified Paracoccus (in: a-proteobacteria)]MDO6670392.1 hypothetical protein [Paracoccus sp. 1_MG-2023]